MIFFRMLFAGKLLSVSVRDKLRTNCSFCCEERISREQRIQCEGSNVSHTVVGDGIKRRMRRSGVRNPFSSSLLFSRFYKVQRICQMASMFIKFSWRQVFTTLIFLNDLLLSNIFFLFIYFLFLLSLSHTHFCLLFGWIWAESHGSHTPHIRFISFLALACRYYDIFRFFFFKLDFFIAFLALEFLRRLCVCALWTQWRI